MKFVRLITLLVALGIPAIAIANAATSANCCKPGAACCDDGSCPFCHHAK
jgi:hypothetical protein